MRRPRTAAFALGLAAVLALGCLTSPAQACHKKRCGCAPAPACHGSWGGYHHSGWGGGGYASAQTGSVGWNSPAYAYTQEGNWSGAGYMAAGNPAVGWNNGGYAPQPGTTLYGYNTTGYTVESAGQSFTQGFVAGAAGMPNPGYYNNNYGQGYPGYGYRGYPGGYTGYRANNAGFGLGRRLLGR